MSTKRAKKGRAGDTSGVGMASRGRPSVGEGDATGEENFIPGELIALEAYGILTPWEQIDAVKFLPDEDTPRFFAIRLKTGEVIVELSSELAERAALLHFKHDEEQHQFTRDLYVIMQDTRRPKQGTTLDEDLTWLASEVGKLKPERILQAASVASRIRENLTERVIEMQRLPIGSRERDKAAKRLQGLFANAIDLLNNPNAKMLDERAIVIEVDTPHGRIQKDVALVAIETAREYVANRDNHFEEPTKGDLSAEIIRKHPKAFSQKTACHSYWNKVWKKAGLSGLRKSEQ